MKTPLPIILILALLCSVSLFGQTVPATVAKEVKLGSAQYLDIVKIETGTPPFTYQWQRNGKDIPDARNNLYYFPAISIADAGEYTVVVKNAAGAAVSNKAVMTVAVSAPGGITIIFRAN